MNFFKPTEGFFPLKKAILYILLSVFCITGGVVLVCAYYHYISLQRVRDPASHLLTLVQTGPQKEALSSVYLAEYLGLSRDRPVSLYGFDPAAARVKLLAHPLIEEARVRLFSPGTLYVDYMLRTPLARLGDYTNTACDASGRLFPFAPFYAQSDLPELFLGLEGTLQPVWGQEIGGREWQLALEILMYFQQQPELQASRLVRIDVAHGWATSYGQREIVLEVEEQTPSGPLVRRLLRLQPAHYKEVLRDYPALRHHLLQQPGGDAVIPLPIDLRIPHMAFIPS